MSRLWPPLPGAREQLTVDGSEVRPRFKERIVADAGIQLADERNIYFGDPIKWILRYDDSSDELYLYFVETSGTGVWQVFGSGSGSTADIHLDGNLEVDGTYVKLPVKTDTGDPSSPADGWMYVNTFDNKVRVYADGAWRDLVTW